MRPLLGVLMAGVIGALIVSCGGCGGGGPDWDPQYAGSRYPQTHYLTVYLHVQAADGGPLGGAWVQVDGHEAEVVSAPRWYAVGAEAPVEWQCWPYNWGVQDLPVSVSYKGQVRQLDLTVGVPGGETKSTTLEVGDGDPETLFVRVSFTFGVHTSAVVQQVQPEYLRPAAHRAHGPQKPLP